MEELYNSISLTGLAASLAAAMGIDAPAQADAPISQLVNLVRNNTKNGRVDRVFMYNPDAVAMWMYQKYTTMFDDVVKHTQLALPLQTVMPSVTPVCFGTMYTGALPEVHGIRRYAKPVIKIDTLFDALIRAGKKPVIVGDAECSLCNIFLERGMDYFPFSGENGQDAVDAINEKAMEIIEEDKYDFVVIYNGNFDSTMHKNGPEAPASMDALRHNVAAFDRFAEALKAKWQHHDTLIGFAMDHGCHEIDGGCGSHGLDMPEDLNIQHHYGILPRKA